MDEKSSDSESYPFINKIVDFIFSKDNKKYILILFIIGFILRFIAANSVGFNADEMLHGTHAINIISSGVINVQNESPVWFYLTDIAYKIFGVHAFSGRFLSIFFGSLTILLIYAFGRNIYNEKVGLIAAALLTFSAFSIKASLMEMDIAMMFFVLLSFYYFDKDIRERNKISYLTAVFMGIAILTKPIALPFLASYGLYFLFFVPNKQKKEFLLNNKKNFIISFLIILFFAMPVIAYNIILYSQKAITDVLFARFFKVNPEIYSSLQGYDKSFELSYLISNGLYATVKPIFFDNEPLIFLIGILGLYLIFSNKKYEKARFFVIFHLIPLIFLMGTSLLSTHFVSFVPLLCLSGAISIIYFSEKLSSRWNPKKIVSISILIIVIINIFLISPHLTSQSGPIQMREYAIDNIKDNEIVIADARIYRGRIAWMFNDKNYLEASYFGKLMDIQQNLSGTAVPTNIYFVECVPDDCGWGTIKNQPEFNASMEEIVKIFSKASQNRETLYGGGGYEDKKGKPYFNIYKVNAPIKPASFQVIKETHEWFYYPVRWEKADWYDKYQINGPRDWLLHNIGKLALWIAVIIGLFSFLIVIKEVIKK